jgi:hypothetical protein
MPSRHEMGSTQVQNCTSQPSHRRLHLFLQIHGRHNDRRRAIMQRGDKTRRLLEHPQQRQLGEGDRMRESEVREHFRVDFCYDAD